MITNISYPGENGVLIEADVDGIHEQIKFSDVLPYWSYATEDDFEGGRAYVKDDYIIFTILVASSQGGVIVVWDTKKKGIVHISNGDYCTAVAIYNDTLFYLCNVYDFVTPSHYQMYSISLNTMDVSDCGKRLYCQNPCKIEEKSINDIDLKVNEHGIQVIINREKTYTYSDTIEETINTVRNENYSWLYDVFTEDSSAHIFEDDSLGGKVDLNIRKVYGWLT